MRAPPLGIVTTALLVSLTVACPGTSRMDASAPLGEAGASAQSACDELATYYCERLSGCTNGRGVERSFASMDDCIARNATQCARTLQTPDVAASPGFIAGCALAYREMSCDAWRVRQTPFECLPPPGHRAAGARCAHDFQCATGRCRLTNTAVCGVCVATVAEGEDCAAAPCARDLRCNFNARTAQWRCRAQVAEGQHCDIDHPCVEGTTCTVPSAMELVGTCTAFAAVAGAPCNASAVGAPLCDTSRGFFCDSTGHCRTSGTASLGGTCGLSQDGNTGWYCLGGALCARRAGEASGFCVAPVAVDAGFPCDLQNGPPCEPLARCIVPPAPRADASADADASVDAGDSTAPLPSGRCVAYDPNAC